MNPTSASPTQSPTKAALRMQAFTSAVPLTTSLITLGLLFLALPWVAYKDTKAIKRLEFDLVVSAQDKRLKWAKARSKALTGGGTSASVAPAPQAQSRMAAMPSALSSNRAQTYVSQGPPASFRDDRPESEDSKNPPPADQKLSSPAGLGYGRGNFTRTVTSSPGWFGQPGSLEHDEFDLPEEIVLDFRSGRTSGRSRASDLQSAISGIPVSPHSVEESKDGSGSQTNASSPRLAWGKAPPPAAEASREKGPSMTESRGMTMGTHLIKYHPVTSWFTVKDNDAHNGFERLLTFMLHWCATIAYTGHYLATHRSPMHLGLLGVYSVLAASVTMKLAGLVFAGSDSVKKQHLRRREPDRYALPKIGSWARYIMIVVALLLLGLLFVSSVLSGIVLGLEEKREGQWFWAVMLGQALYMGILEPVLVCIGWCVYGKGCCGGCYRAVGIGADPGVKEVVLA